MLIPLREASPDRCGAKAATLSVLLRAGLPVPDGFVMPIPAAPGAGVGSRPVLPAADRNAVADELHRMEDPVVAVRSSGATEDAEGASAAGQYESILGVHGTADVCDAIIACQASARTALVADYWKRITGHTAGSSADMAVLVQQLIAAEVSGVMFTPAAAANPTRIEASWGLGPAVVGGVVTPDSYEIGMDGAVQFTIGDKETRIDRDDERGGLIDRRVDERMRTARTLGPRELNTLAGLGAQIATMLGAAQDIEWAIAEGEVWILQSRPITASVPQPSVFAAVASHDILAGASGSRGVVTAPARIVLGPQDFSRVRPGEIVVCPSTDPAWTPLFGIAAGIVAERGGVLSHAAIVAREYGIPAVLGIAEATRRIDDGHQITIDGTEGTMTVG